MEENNLGLLKAKNGLDVTVDFERKLDNDKVRIQASQICLRVLSLVFDHMLERD